MKRIVNIPSWIKSNYVQFALLIYIILILVVPKIPLIKTSVSIPIRLDDLLIVPLILLAAIKYRHDRSHLKLFSNSVSMIALLWLVVLLVCTVIGIAERTVSDPKIGLLFWLRYVQYISVMWVAYIALPSLNQMKKYFLVLVGLLIPLGIYGIFQRLGIIGGYGGGFYNYIWVSVTDRSFATFAGPYELAAYLVLTIPMLVALLLALKRHYHYLGWAVVMIVSVLSISFTAARTPLAGVFVGINTLLLFVSEWRKRALIFGLSLIFLIIPFFVSDTLVTRTNDLLATFRSYSNSLSAEKTTTPGIQLTEKTTTANTQPTTGNQSTGNQSSTTVSSPTVPTTTHPVTIPKTNPVVKNVVHVAGKILESENNNVTSKPAAAAVASSPTSPNTVTIEPSLKWRIENLWPKAINNFLQNPLFGSGLSSAGISVDSTYLTLLGETGLIGISIFILLMLLIVRLLVQNIRLSHGIDRLLFIGFLGGLIGLLINAVFIDVFRASKIAYTFWILVGLSIRYFYLLRKQYD